jgi:hypothetical protein
MSAAGPSLLFAKMLHAFTPACCKFERKPRASSQLLRSRQFRYVHLFLQEKVRVVKPPDYTYCENALSLPALMQLMGKPPCTM